MSAAPTWDQLGWVVTAAMEQHSVPGVVVGVLHAGEEHAAGFGMTSVEHPLTVDPDTLFQIGSITKTVTATALLRLVEQGRIGLDTPLRTYLPNLRLWSEETAAEVTLRHLLTHTGGWVGDYFDDLGPGEDALARYVANMADLAQVVPLGELYSYNNAGFSLAGRLIEVVTGRPFEAALTELVLEPLGMTRAFFSAAEVITERFAVGHQVADAGPTMARPWALPRTAHPAGGLITSVRELFRYARFHLGDGTTADGVRLLSPETLALMQTPHVPTSRLDEAVGLAWMLREVDGTRIVAHGGGTNGQTTSLLLVPARGFALIVLTNASRGGALVGEVTKWALREHFGLVEPEPAPIEAPAEQLAAYAGRYAATLTDVELALRDGGLMLQVIPKGGFPTKDSPPWPAPPSVRTALCGEDSLVVLDPPLKDARIEFLRSSDGRIAWLRSGGRLHARQE